MTSITVLTEDKYHEGIEKAESGEASASPEFARKTNITPDDMIGNVVTFCSPRTHHSHTMGEVTAIDMNAENCPKATISELFTDREFTETGHYFSNDHDNGFINLSLPILGNEHTVEWLEAKVDGEWERVSDISTQTPLNDFTRLKHTYDTTRVVQQTYTHNPQGLCANPIRPNDDKTSATVVPDREQFINRALYDRLMDAVVIPETAGRYTRLGTLYTQSDERQHDAERAHKIIDIQVDRVAKPEGSVTGLNSPFDTNLPLPEKIKYVLGPNPREDIFGEDPTKDSDDEKQKEAA